jgi:hypothetical protein
MPTISVFYGIVIRMYFNDHAPPHLDLPMPKPPPKPDVQASTKTSEAKKKPKKSSPASPSDEK